MKKIVSGIILLAMCVGIIYVYPLRLAYVNPYVSEGSGLNLFATENFGEDIAVVQEFVPRLDYLDSIDLVLHNPNENKKGELIITFYNATMEKQFEKTVSLADIPNFEYYNVSIKEKVKQGEIYFYAVEGHDYGATQLQLFATDAGNKALESGTYTQADTPNVNSLAVNYHYLIRIMSLEEAVPYIGMVLVGGSWLLIIVNKKRGVKVDAENLK